MKISIPSLFLSVFVTLSFFNSSAQHPDGGGHYEAPKIPCITPAQIKENDKVVNANRALLLAAGILKAPKKNRSVSLGWPLQQAAGFDYCSYYGISNFVDHNAAYPNQVLDYECGNRTYDLASGYNHGGMDIYLWPFDWNMVNAGQVEVVAAAPGIITAKFDGNTDMNCDFSNPNWNAVYVEHSDGTVAWYGHMKNGSLTVKPVGGSVVQGEKLGLVASSGSSTGPHLHFELHDVGGNVIDPNDGVCNPGGTNLWSSPKPYYEPTINVALTHSQPPVFNPCPNTHTTNLSDIYYASDDIYFAGYFHDQLTSNTATYTVKRPDNSTFATWTHTPPVYYSSSYWYWQYAIPAVPQYGTWTYSISMNGQTCSHNFDVIDPGATSVNSIDKNKQSMLITPNPAKDIVHITGTKAPIEVYDIHGKLLHTYTNTSSIDVSAYNNGLYIVRAGSAVQKLVVMHD